MKKDEKKRIKKINIEYECGNYGSLMCVITSIKNHKLISSMTLNNRKMRSIPLINNEFIWNLDIRFYTAEAYELLFTYHFNDEDFGCKDDIIEHTQYYCRIKKQQVKGCLIIFDLIYEIDQDLQFKKQQQKYAKITKSSNNPDPQDRKYQQVNYLLQCHQIVKKVYSQLSSQAVKKYLQQKQQQRKIVKQLKQIYSSQQNEEKNQNLTKFDCLTKNKRVASNNYIKSTLSSSKKLQSSQRFIKFKRSANQTQLHINNNSINGIKDCSNTNSINQIIDTQNKFIQNQNNHKNQNIQYKSIKKPKKQVKRITIEKTLEPQLLNQYHQIANSSNKPSVFIKKQATKQIRWGDLEKTNKQKDQLTNYLLSGNQREVEQLQQKNQVINKNHSKSLFKNREVKEESKLKMICQFNNKCFNSHKNQNSQNKQNIQFVQQQSHSKLIQQNTQKQLKDILQNSKKWSKIQKKLIKDYLITKKSIQHNKKSFVSQLNYRSSNLYQKKLFFQNFAQVSIQNLTKLYRKTTFQQQNCDQVQHSGIQRKDKQKLSLKKYISNEKSNRTIIKQCYKISKPNSNLNKIKSTPTSFRNEEIRNLEGLIKEINLAKQQNCNRKSIKLKKR